MRKIILSTFLLASSCLFSYAQKEVKVGLKSINKNNAKVYVSFLANNLLEGREAGQRGGKLAALYITSELKRMGVKPLFNKYRQPFSAYHKERQVKGARWQVNQDSINKIKNSVHQRINLNNILAAIPGKKKNEFVVVGAHYDHLGIDPLLEGDKIYNGADDNASGVSAVLQIAKAFVKSGKQPERTVIFAFWDGEEKGLLGSKYFIENCSFLKDIKGYVNFDMIGRNNNEAKPKDVVYFYTASHSIFEKWLKDDIKKYKLELEPNYRAWDKPTGGSDNTYFAKHNIPIIWYHTNGHPDYHMPSDHAKRINWDKLTYISKAAFLNMWYMANTKF